jgi:type IV pilus assembly protein PilC
MLERFLRSNKSVPLKELSILLKAGHPLIRTLELVCSDSHPHIARSVENGSSFADAISKDLPMSAVSLIRAGEASGKLDAGIYAAWKSIETIRNIRRKLVGTLIYPAFVLAVCFIALLVFSSIVLPSFASTLMYSGAKLPFISKAVVVFGYNMPFIISASLIVGAFSIWYIYGDGGFSVPLVRGIKKKLLLSSFFRIMSTSLSSGTSLLDALKLTISTTSSPVFKEKLTFVHSQVREGKEFSVCLKGTGFFDDTAISLIMAGERSAALTQVFEQLSCMYEEGVEETIKMSLSMVEPASTLIVGLVVGIIVLAMFLPMIQLVGALGG